MFLSLLYVNVGDDPDRPQPGRLWLRDLYRVHQRLWMAFPDDRRRVEDPFFLGTWDGPALPDPKPKRGNAGFLFRIERDGPPRILVQSVQEPAWDYAFQNTPYLLVGQPKKRQFDPAPRLDGAYHFRLLANVVRRTCTVDPARRIRQRHNGKAPLPLKLRRSVPLRLNPVPDTMPSDPDERRRVLDARWAPWRGWIEDVGVRCGFRVLDEKPAPLFMQSVHVAVRRPAKGHDGDGTPKSPIRYNAGLFEGLLVCTDPERLRTAVVNGIGPAKGFGFGLLSVAPIA